MSIVLPLVITAGTLLLILWRPRRVTEAHAALLGALLMVVTGSVPPLAAVRLAWESWNILLFFFGLMVIAACADQAGFFSWLAARAAHAARGDGRRLLLAVFAVGTVVTAILSNDSTALILTPVVYVLVTRLRLDPLPYLFACTFIADTASAIFPMANPVNLLAVDTFRISLGEYVRYLFLPSVVAIVINAWLFLKLFRWEILRDYDAQEFATDLPPTRYLRATLWWLGALGVAYLAAATWRIPLAVVTLPGAAGLLVTGALMRALDWRRVRFSWTIFGFIIGLVVIVEGINRTGLLAMLAKWLISLGPGSSLVTILATTLGVAIGSNIVNNWTAMLIAVHTLAELPGIGGPDRPLIFAAIFGADLGPNITTIGSLATILWLTLLAERGVLVRPVTYLKVGLIVTPWMLLSGAVLIWLMAKLPLLS